MHILDDVNYEIAVLQRNIKDTYNASTEASARADFVAAALMLEAADDLQQELRAALDFRADLLGEVPCDTCDGDQCSNCYYDGANNGTTVTLQISEDLDQSYQLDVLLNELNVMGAQIEYLQDQVDFLQEELTDAEAGIDFYVGQSMDEEARADALYNALASIADLSSCRISNCCNVESRLNQIFLIAEGAL